MVYKMSKKEIEDEYNAVSKPEYQTHKYSMHKVKRCGILKGEKKVKKGLS